MTNQSALPCLSFHDPLSFVICVVNSTKQPGCRLLALLLVGTNLVDMLQCQTNVIEPL
jgi:hypothetical protein